MLPLTTGSMALAQTNQPPVSVGPTPTQQSEPARELPRINLVPTGEPSRETVISEETKEVRTSQREEGDAFSLGIGPLVFANMHFLDKPGRRKVEVNGVHGKDAQYPGFIGTDITVGLALDLRYMNAIGLELDLLYQSDEGTGTVRQRSRNSVCYVPSVMVSGPTESYDITIGQRAWHLPILLKLVIPHSHDWFWERERRHSDRHGGTTLAFGPEFVFPEAANLEISPNGLESPKHATASPYVMYTGAIGGEYRVTRSIDLRLFGSLRGSYNPEPKDSVQRRATYELSGGELVAISYRSEWRYQFGATFGIGWFF
jgi:hypothetical protein